jgi:tetratricopeptide (TPR) repeat protein
LKESPGDLPNLRRLARVYEQAKKTDQAVDTYKRILRIEPTDFDAETRISEIELSKYDRRIAKLQQMVKADPGDAKSGEELKKTKAARLKFEVEDLAKRVAAHPTETALRLKFGRALFHAGKLNDAVSEFQQTKGEPQHSRESAFWLGRCFLKGGKDSLAVKQLEKVVADGGGGKLDDLAKEAHYFLGKALESMDDSDGAREHWERIYEEDINFRDVAALVEG